MTADADLVNKKPPHRPPSLISVPQPDPSKSIGIDLSYFQLSKRSRFVGGQNAAFHNRVFLYPKSPAPHTVIEQENPNTLQYSLSIPPFTTIYEKLLEEGPDIAAELGADGAGKEALTVLLMEPLTEVG
ncbi:hypothetical protein PIB30_087669 [Stylosanthes scabra]|uniref:Uncharacterized protein n=1 Tax=Stylosanthes scabra TaxID=79078 RepID=A0ABU6TU36_9FABA|nr:hypothetical protein [Stylosanthes scabra]